MARAAEEQGPPADASKGGEAELWTTDVWRYGSAFRSSALEVDTHTLFFVRMCMLCSPRHPEECHMPRYLNRLNIAYAVVLQVVNSVLQIVITYILVLDVEEQEHTWESKYFEKHFGMTLGGAVKLLADVKGPVDPHTHHGIPAGIFRKCQEQTKFGLKHLSFYHLMIFVWVTKMFYELVSCIVLATRIWKVQAPQNGEESAEAFSLFDQRVQEERELADPASQREEGLVASSRDSRRSLLAPGLDLTSHANTPAPDAHRKGQRQDRSCNIIYLSCCLKAALIVMVPLLRLFIAFWITYAGAKFIMLQRSYEKVVLKALCMQWVTQIDEILVKSFTTKTTQDIIRKVNIFHKNFLTRDWWENGVGGAVMFALGSLAVAFVTCFLFGDLMRFRSECLRVTGVGYTQTVKDELTGELRDILMD